MWLQNCLRLLFQIKKINKDDYDEDDFIEDTELFSPEFIIYTAKKTGLTLDELDSMTLGEFIDYAFYFFDRENSDREMDATQNDFDNF